MALRELTPEYHAAMDAYEERFGEEPPLAMMPFDPDAQIALVRECLEAGSTDPIERRFPPGTYT